MSSQINLKPNLNGIRFWAIHHLHSIPKIEVYRYVGHEPSTGRHFFQSVRGKSVIHRTHYQLHTASFKPFLLDSELLGLTQKETLSANL